MTERIAKYLARCGIASRRGAEELITQGFVKVDGKTITSPALNVTAQNKITFKNKAVVLPENTLRLWRYHKVKGLLTTNKDPDGRPTIFEKLPEELPRVITIGRLDLNSEGLLLLTNNGGLARHLELPSTAWKRTYRVRVFGKIDNTILEPLKHGVTIDGVKYAPIMAELERQQGDNAWLLVTLTEGKNREIRKVMEYLGYSVNRLLRVSYGPFQLGKLAEGAVEEVPLRILKASLGRELMEKLR
jgi:23S rRNA pseudouridine2605 synthase